MLSKSAARAFFLGGTALCSVAFVLLGVDSFRRIPEQTNTRGLTASVIRGKQLWEENNCMGCHTLFGEGAYYAPELTRVYARRGDAFIRGMLRDPESMYPGQRRMVRYDFNEAQIDDLVAFFEWTNTVDLNGFPAAPTIAMQGSPAPASIQSSRPRMFDQVCTACHSVAGRGGAIGPPLDGIATRRDRDYLVRWLRDPTAVKPGTTMPNLHIAEAQLTELVDYLVTLDEGGTP